jgi:preprotein translocase subunit SecG
MNYDLIVTLLYIVFIVSAIVLCIVILLQEGKGGGLTDALGSAGQQTFGVAASGIHKFTGWTAAIFIASALGIHMANNRIAGSSVVDPFDNTPSIEAPPVPPASDTPPADGK